MRARLRKIILPPPRIKRLQDFAGDIPAETKYLAGRNSLFKDFIRLLRISLEYFRGMRILQSIGPAVTVFGSARFHDGHPYYDLARTVGRVLANEGYTVMTGGGPGIMEAANRGAKEVGGESVGCNVYLPHEQRANPYLSKVVTFYYFFVRKVMLVKYSYAFVILPGGMGTLDEMTEAVTLIQTGKLYDFPVILMGKEYWAGYMDWVQNVLVKNGAVSQTQLDFVHLTDDPEEMIRIIRKTVGGLSITLTPLNSSSI